MSLLDKLHDKALSATKKHVKYPLLIASGIADWFAGTYDEMKGHGEAVKASGEKDYKLYEEGLSAAALGEAGAFAAAVYTHNKAGAVILGADLLVRDINGFISGYKEFKRINENPDAERVINVDLTGAIGTARTLAYKLANRRRRPDVAAEPVEDDGTEETPLIFPDPLPEPVPDPIPELVLHPLKGEEFPDPFRDDEMGIMDKKPGLEDKVSDTGVEEIVEPEPAPMPLPRPEEGYTLPDILEEDGPSYDCGGRGRSCGTSCRGDCGTKPTEDKPLGESAPQAPSSKPKVDIGPLSTLPDDEDPLGSADEEETGNKLF